MVSKPGGIQMLKASFLHLTILVAQQGFEPLTITLPGLSV